MKIIPTGRLYPVQRNVARCHPNWHYGQHSRKSVHTAPFVLVGHCVVVVFFDDKLRVENELRNLLGEARKGSILPQKNGEKYDIYIANRIKVSGLERNESTAVLVCLPRPSKVSGHTEVIGGVPSRLNNPSALLDLTTKRPQTEIKKVNKFSQLSITSGQWSAFCRPQYSPIFRVRFACHAR